MANHQSIGVAWYANGNWQEITVSQQHGDMRNISHANCLQSTLSMEENHARSGSRWQSQIP